MWGTDFESFQGYVIETGMEYSSDRMRASFGGVLTEDLAGYIDLSCRSEIPQNATVPGSKGFYSAYLYVTLNSLYGNGAGNRIEVLIAWKTESWQL